MSLTLSQAELNELADGPCYCTKLRRHRGHENGICLACYRADPVRFESVVRAARNAYRERLAEAARRMRSEADAVTCNVRCQASSPPVTP